MKTYRYELIKAINEEIKKIELKGKDKDSLDRFKLRRLREMLKGY